MLAVNKNMSKQFIGYSVYKAGLLSLALIVLTTVLFGCALPQDCSPLGMHTMFGLSKAEVMAKLDITDSNISGYRGAIDDMGHLEESFVIPQEVSFLGDYGHIRLTFYKGILIRATYGFTYPSAAFGFAKLSKDQIMRFLGESNTYSEVLDRLDNIKSVSEVQRNMIPYHESWGLLRDADLALKLYGGETAAELDNIIFLNIKYDYSIDEIEERSTVVLELAPPKYRRPDGEKLIASALPLALPSPTPSPEPETVEGEAPEGEAVDSEAVDDEAPIASEVPGASATPAASAAQ